MSYRNRKLLTLIHNHLLQNGYGKTARELQIESGEKFPVQKLMLTDIFKHWMQRDKKKEEKKKKKKKKKKTITPNDSQSKLPQLQALSRTSESSEDEENGETRTAKGKKVSDEKAAKTKPEPVTPQKMDSAKKSEAKVKDTPKTRFSDSKPRFHPSTESSDKSDSNSDEEMAPSKAALIQATPLKSTPAKSKTLSATDAEAPRHDESGPARNAHSATNGKAVVKSDDRESSDSSDETDIEKQLVPQNITAPSSVKASKKNTETPSAVTQPATDNSESSESESEEEQKVPTPATPQVKAAAPAAKTRTQVKATKVKTANKATTTRGLSEVKPVLKSESTEESDTDNEMVPSTPQPAAPSSGQTSKQKVPLQPTPLRSKAEDSSESSDSESEETPVKMTPVSPRKGVTPASALASKPNAVVPTRPKNSEDSDSSDSDSVAKAPKTPVSPRKGVTPASALASKLNTVVPTRPESSEDSDSSDSDSVAKAPKKAAILLASAVQTPVPSAKQPGATSFSGKARSPPPNLVDDTSETEDSDSYEEPEAKKTDSKLQTSKMETPSMGAATTKTRTPLQTIVPSADGSETDDSDSDEEPEAMQSPIRLPASCLKTPSTSTKQSVTASAGAKKPGNLLKAAATAHDSSETDDDSDEDELDKKTPSLPASSVKTPSTGATQPVTANAAAKKTGNLLKTPAAADDSSESDDSDEDEEPKKTPSLPASGVKTPSTSAKQPLTANVAAKSPGNLLKTPAAVEDSSESDDSDEDEGAKKTSSLPASSVKTPSTGAQQPVTATAAAKPGKLLKTPAAVDDSSESDDSDEDEGAKVSTQAVSDTNVKTITKSTALAKSNINFDIKLGQQCFVQLSKITLKTPSHLPASSVKTPSTGAKQPVTANAAAKKTRNLLKTPAAADDSSESDDSDEDEGAKKTPSLPTSNAKTPSTGATQPVTANAAAKKTRNLLKTPAAADDSSESDDSDEDEGAKVSTQAVSDTNVKSITKSTALAKGNQTPVTTFSRTMVDESSEESDSDDKVSPSKKIQDTPRLLQLSGQWNWPCSPATPSTKSRVKTPAVVSDSDADSESSDFSDSEQKTKAEVTTCASLKKIPSTPSAATRKATKEKTPASSKVAVAQKPRVSSSESSDSLDEDISPAQELKGSLTTKPSAVKLSQRSAVATKKEAQSPAKAVTDTQPVTNEKSSDSSGSSDSEEQVQTLKTRVTALAQHKVATPIPLSTSTPVIASPPSSKAGLPTKSPKSVKTKHKGKKAKKVKTPEPASAKAKLKKRKSILAKTPISSKSRKEKSAGQSGTPAAEKKETLEESSEPESNSLDENAAKAKLAPLQIKLDTLLGKKTTAKPKSKTKTTSKLAVISREAPDGNEEPVVKEKGARTAERTDNKASGHVSSKPTANYISEPEESQSILQSSTKSSKKRKRTEDATSLANESIAKTRKKKSKLQTAPVTPTLPAPTTPGALLDSEEETVLALLEGRSPKKAKKSSSKKTAAAMVLDFAQSIPGDTSLGGTKLNTKSPAVPEPNELSAVQQKSGKKRKRSSDDGLSKKKDKKAKKAKKKKKDKKLKLAITADEGASAKPSKKEKKKSGKDKKKKKDKEKKKKSKKLEQSIIAPVGESTDSGVSLQSKPKKKKTKGDKKT